MKQGDKHGDKHGEEISPEIQQADSAKYMVAPILWLYIYF